MSDNARVTKYFIFKILGFSKSFRLFMSRLFSIKHYFVAYAKISEIKESRHLRSPLGTLALIQPSDIQYIKNQLCNMSPDDKSELIIRILFFLNGFKHGYVFRIRDKIAYMQWLIYPHENSIILKKYRKKYYQLMSNQVMIENAFTFPEFRGQGLLPMITKKLLDIARVDGHEYAVSYIRKDKIASINEFLKLNFKIRKLIAEYKVLGIAWRTL